MKKQKYGFRQKLGIVLAAGMIISNVNFAVLSVSATDLADDPNDPAQENTMPIDPEVQNVLNAIDRLPSLEEVQGKSFEDQITIRDEVDTIAAAVADLVTKQKNLPENARETVDTLQEYFTTLAETGINPIEDDGQPAELVADKKTSIVNTVSDYLAGEIKKIAAGTRTSTEIDVFNLIYTGSNADDVSLLFEEIKDKSNEMFQSLLITYQNDLYWFDKSYKDATTQGGFSFSGNYSITGTAVTGSAVFRFVVSPEYRVSADNLYTLDTTKINSANTALAKAQAIVDANAGKSDYEKLLAYKNAICELTSYDHDAAKPGYTGSKAPWQMVSVFDGDPNTKVVCEGYSKAFQYLCDLSTFKNAKCYTVSGTMAGGTGAGGHMWNIVSIGGNNYLVDVTNCDEKSVGAPDKLFMAVPSSGEWNGTYVFASASNINYTYNAETISYYGESILKLSTTPYDPTKDPVVDDPTDKPGTDNPDDNKPNRPSKPTTPSKPSNKPGSSSSGSDSGNQTRTNTSTQTTPTTVWAVETSPSDQNNYRLEVRSAIEVPAELAGNDTLNTPQKIESQIRSSLTAKGISNDNIRVYDVALQVYANGTWQDVSAENFPAEGVTVTVPYPSGTDSTYNFVASHLFTKSMNGFPAGHIETFPESGAITKSSAGISFTVHGLSPISVGWSKAAAGTSTNVSPKTGDQSTILLYMVLMIFATAIMGTVYVKQIRVRKK